MKTYAAEGRETTRFMKDNQRHLDYVLRQSHLGHAMGALSELLVHLGTAIIIGYGGWIALHTSSFTAGDIAKFIGYVGVMYGPVRRFADLNLVYQNSLASVRRIFRVFDIQPKIVDKPNAIQTIPMRGEVVYENVRFRYGDDTDESRTRLDEDEPEVSPYRITEPKHVHGTWVLDQVNLRIGAGERVALVGPSGSGKTTLASLLPRSMTFSTAQFASTASTSATIRSSPFAARLESFSRIRFSSAARSGTTFSTENRMPRKPN